MRTGTRIHLRVWEDELEAWREAAISSKMSLSAWIKMRCSLEQESSERAGEHCMSEDDTLASAQASDVALVEDSVMARPKKKKRAGHRSP